MKTNLKKGICGEAISWHFGDDPFVYSGKDAEYFF